MIPTTKPISPSIISIFVCEETQVLEVCGTCWFVLLEGLDYGYIYTEPEAFEDNLSRAYDILFEETLKRLETRGIHLHL